MKISVEKLLSMNFSEIYYDNKVKGYIDPENVLTIFLSDEILKYLYHIEKISEPIEFILPRSNEAKPPTLATVVDGAVTDVNITVKKTNGNSLAYIDKLYVFDPRVLRYYIKKYKLPIRYGKYKYYLIYKEPYGNTSGIVLIEFSNNLYMIYAPTTKEVNYEIVEYPRNIEFLRRNIYLLKIKDKILDIITSYANAKHKAVISSELVSKYFPNYILFEDAIREFLRELREKVKSSISENKPTISKAELERLIQNILERHLHKYVHIVFVNIYDSSLQARLILKDEYREKLAEAEKCDDIYIRVYWNREYLAVYLVCKKGRIVDYFYETLLKVTKPIPNFYYMPLEKIKKEIYDLADILYGVIENKLKGIKQNRRELILSIKKELATSSTPLLEEYLSLLNEEELPPALKKFKELGIEEIKKYVLEELKYRKLKRQPRRRVLPPEYVKYDIVPSRIYKIEEEEIPDEAINELKRIFDLEGFKYGIYRIPSDKKLILYIAIRIATNPRFPYSFREKILSILRLYKLF